MSFVAVDLKSLSLNPFTKISKEWFLVTAGNGDSYNTMTASWGEMGHLWGKDVITTVIRPQRYTKEFIDREELFTISFLPDGYRKALNLLGTVSGRKRDKVNEAGLTPVPVDGSMTFAEAELVFVCKKVYSDVLRKENFFIDTIPAKNYPDEDYHVAYVGEIIGAYQKV